MSGVTDYENINYGNTFASLLARLLLRPNEKIELEELFTSITIKFCDLLHHAEMNDEIISTFESALEIYPDSPNLLNAFGCSLVR